MKDWQREGLAIFATLREAHFPDCCLSSVLTHLFHENKHFRLCNPKIAQMEREGAGRELIHKMKTFEDTAVI